MDQARRELFISALIAKGATKPCARCGALHFEVEAEANIPTVLAGAVLPVVLVACLSCGLVSPYATLSLGMKPLT